MVVKVYTVTLTPATVEAADKVAKVLGFKNRSKFVEFALNKIILEVMINGKKLRRTRG